MNTTSDNQSNPTAFGHKTGDSIVLVNSPQFDVGEITDKLWEELEFLHFEHRVIIRHIRHRLTDSGSGSINAGTVLALLTAINSAKAKLLVYASNQSQKEEANKQKDFLKKSISSIKNSVTIGILWKRDQFYTLIACTVAVIASFIIFCFVLDNWMDQSNLATLQQMTANDTVLRDEIKYQGNLNRMDFQRKIPAGDILFREYPPGSLQIWIPEPSELYDGYWETRKFVRQK